MCNSAITSLILPGIAVAIGIDRSPLSECSIFEAIITHLGITEIEEFERRCPADHNVVMSNIENLQILWIHGTLHNEIRHIMSILCHDEGIIWGVSNHHTILGPA